MAFGKEEEIQKTNMKSEKYYGMSYPIVAPHSIEEIKYILKFCICVPWLSDNVRTSY